MTPPDPLLRDGLAALRQRTWPQAVDIAQQLLDRSPGHAVAHFIGGVACLELRRLGPAIEHLRQACDRDPCQSEYFVQLARAFLLARMNPQAIHAADVAWSMKPDNSSALDIIGRVYAETQRHTMAATVYQQAVEMAPAAATHRFNLAAVLINLGEFDKAQYELQTCLALDPLNWKAHLALSHLRRQTCETNRIEHLIGLLENYRENHEADICLNMALAKEYEDIADYSAAFAHLSQGKAAARRDVRYDASHDEKLFAALQRACPKPAQSVAGHPSDAPIFVFGMPRSGTTLVERVLSSHPQVQSAGELQAFGIALRQHWGSAVSLLDDPQSAERARLIDWRAVGESYLSSARPAGNSPHFVDKLPHNFLYAGFIAMAFPRARIICLRRHAMDTCLGNFRQLFADKLPYYNYSFDLMDTGRYYVLFDRLMTHWNSVFPGRIHEVHYEKLVHDQEATTRKLLTHCGLQWHDGCLNFEANSAAVATASAVQVRQPIYRSAVHRWKVYEQQLAPLFDYLTQAGIRFER